MEINALIRQINQAAVNVYSVLPSGMLEEVYKNALAIELQEMGLTVEKEVPINVTYKGHIVGIYRVDLLVDHRLILELKSVRALNVSHELQLVNYLKAFNIDDGLLINFGEKFEIKRKYKDYKPTNS